MKSTLAGPTASCLFLLALIATSIVADAFPIRQIDTLLFTRHAGSATVTHSYGYPNPAPANAGPAVTSAADLASGNAFADGAADDNSPTCAAARAQISRWANVTECFGPVTQLFFATPEQVCAGKCLEVTVQASAIITKACAQSVPKEGNFGRSGVYKVWSDPVGAQSACAVLAKSTDYDTFPFEVSPDEDGPLTEFKIAGAKASVGVKASVGSGGGEATASMPYTIEAVFDLYMQWKAAKSDMPDHTQLLPEATRKTLAASQCTRFNRDFWSAFISKPGGQPTLYYWSILEPQDYVKDLESICGPGYLTPAAATQAAAAAASTTTPCDESKITSSAAVPTH